MTTSVALVRVKKVDGKLVKASEVREVKKVVVVDDTKLSSEVHTVKDLDKAVSEARRFHSEGAVAYWRLGKTIHGIIDNQLWKLRNDDNGKPKYRSTDGFIHFELKMTPTSAYLAAKVSQNYTEAQARDYGTSKLGLILQAPNPVQKKLMNKLVSTTEKGLPTPSYRDIEKEVREANVKQREKNGDPTFRETRGKPMPTSPGRRREKITIASVLGQQTIRLYAKSTKTLPKKDWKRARRLADMPWGTMELENGVIQTFQVQESPGGELLLRVVTARDDEE